MQIHLSLWNDMLHLCKSISLEHYTHKNKALQNTSISQHLRHAYEFYTCLLRGLDTGIVDYEARKRDTLLETDIAYAQQQIEALIGFLSSCPTNISMTLCSKESRQETAFTSFDRELVYCLDHAIHHQAIIKIGLHDMDLAHLVGPHFGVAYSTLRYRKQSLD